MSMLLEDFPEADYARTALAVGQLLDIDVVLSAIVTAECIRLRSTRTVAEMRDCCMVVVTRSPLCRRAFHEMVVHDLGEMAAGLIESWATQNGAICWPQLKSRMVEQLRRADVRPGGPMAVAVAQETPLGSICLLVMTVVNDRLVTGVVQHPMPEFLTSESPRKGSE
jgi:hypothetical protein